MSLIEEATPSKRKVGRPRLNPKKPIGRPTMFSPKLAELICKGISEGKTLRHICTRTEMPSLFTVLKWLKKYPEFGQEYALARETQVEAWADQIVDISDDSKDARLQVDTRKWLMARLAPKKYGDKTTSELTGVIVHTLADLVNQSYQEPKLVEGKEIKDGDGKADKPVE